MPPFVLDAVGATEPVAFGPLPQYFLRLGLISSQGLEYSQSLVQENVLNQMQFVLHRCQCTYQPGSVTPQRFHGSTSQPNTIPLFTAYQCLQGYCPNRHKLQKA